MFVELSENNNLRMVEEELLLLKQQLSFGLDFVAALMKTDSKHDFDENVARLKLVLQSARDFSQNSNVLFQLVSEQSIRERNNCAKLLRET